MLVLVLVCGAVACRAGARTRDVACRFGAEARAFSSASLAFDDIALIESADEALAAFSDESGAFVRRLELGGRPLAAPERVGERCTGGLALAAAGKQVWIACLRPGASRDASAGHAVALYRYARATGPMLVAELGTAGSKSRGVALALSDDDSLLLGFQDAIVGEARSWLASVSGLAGGAVHTATRVLSDPSLRGSAPSFAARGGHVSAVWSETRDDGSGRVLWSNLRSAGQARALFTTRDPQPDATLAALGSRTGDFVLGFRDRRDGRRKVGFHLASLDLEGHVTRAPLRVARADGAGRPALRVCATAGAATGETSIVAATPRTFGGDYFVGALRIDAELEHLSGEQQFYEDTREFSDVAVACGGSPALLLIGERGKPGHSRAALRAVSLTCP